MSFRPEPKAPAGSEAGSVPLGSCCCPAGFAFASRAARFFKNVFPESPKHARSSMHSSQTHAGLSASSASRRAYSAPSSATLGARPQFDSAERRGFKMENVIEDDEEDAEDQQQKAGKAEMAAPQSDMAAPRSRSVHDAPLITMSSSEDATVASLRSNISSGRSARGKSTSAPAFLAATGDASCTGGDSSRPEPTSHQVDVTQSVGRIAPTPPASSDASSSRPSSKQSEVTKPLDFITPTPLADPTFGGLGPLNSNPTAAVNDQPVHAQTEKPSKKVGSRPSPLKAGDSNTYGADGLTSPKRNSVGDMIRRTASNYSESLSSHFGMSDSSRPATSGTLSTGVQGKDKRSPKRLSRLVSSIWKKKAADADHHETK